jgi:hypothetical protein
VRMGHNDHRLTVALLAGLLMASGALAETPQMPSARPAEAQTIQQPIAAPPVVQPPVATRIEPIVPPVARVMPSRMPGSSPAKAATTTQPAVKGVTAVPTLPALAPARTTAAGKSGPLAQPPSALGATSKKCGPGQVKAGTASLCGAVARPGRLAKATAKPRSPAATAKTNRKVQLAAKRR